MKKMKKTAIIFKNQALTEYCGAKKAGYTDSIR